MEKSLNLFYNNIMKLRVYVYDFLKIIEKNDSNENENNKNKDDDKIQKESKCKAILSILEQLNKNLLQINRNEINIEGIDFSKNPYIYKKPYERENFYIMFFKNWAEIKDNILERELYKRELNICESRIARIRFNRLQRQRNEIEKTINDIINEYINNGFKEAQIQKQPNKNDYPNIYFNCKESQEEFSVEISITFFIFDIKIKMPFNKIFNYQNYYNKINIILEKNIYTFQIENNIPDISEDIPKKEKYENLLLIKYINEVFATVSYILISRIINQKNQFLNQLNVKPQVVGKDILIEFCKRFIYYIHDYNNLFKVKCSICGKSAKYSSINKCFFPPYYKIYQERETINYISNTEGTPINLFYHKECYKRLDFPN
jgi:hypothetical protein